MFPCLSFPYASASLVSFMDFMVAAEKESCLSCWLSIADMEARKIVIAFIKRVHILVSIRGKTPTNKQTQNKMKSHILIHGPVEYVFNHRSTYKQDFIAIRSFKFQSLVVSFRDRSKHVQEPSLSQMRDFWSAASMFAQSYLSSH